MYVCDILSPFRESPPPHGKTELISQLLMTNHFYLAFETWCDLSRLLQIPERDI